MKKSISVSNLTLDLWLEYVRPAARSAGILEEVPARDGWHEYTAEVIDEAAADEIAHCMYCACMNSHIGNGDYLDKEQVIFWLEQFKDGNIEDEDFRRQLIDLFVNSVTVWDEPDDYFKITIAYNLTSLQDKTYRLPKGGTLSDFASNTPPYSSRCRVD